MPRTPRAGFMTHARHISAPSDIPSSPIVASQERAPKRKRVEFADDHQIESHHENVSLPLCINIALLNRVHRAAICRSSS